MGEAGAGRPPTQRVRSGVSPRLSALALGALLVGLAGLGLASRQQAEQAPPSPPVGGVLPSAPSPAAATPSTRQPPASPRPTVTPRPTPFVMPAPAAGESELAVHVTLGGQQLVAYLTETARGQLYGAVRFDFPRPARVGTLRLLQYDTDDDEYAQLGAFRLSLHPLIPETRRSGTVIEQAVAPDLERDVPAVLREGYRLTVRAEGRESFALLRINLVIGAMTGVRP